MSTHDQMLSQAERMRNTCKDWLDQPGHAQAKQVQQGIERLISDLKQKRDGNSIDNDLKTIISSLDRVEEEVMDHHHSDQLKSQCEDMRRDTRNI